MKRFWNREALRFVDAWACKVGTPEDEEDEKSGDEDNGDYEHGIANENGEEKERKSVGKTKESGIDMMSRGAKAGVKRVTDDVKSADTGHNAIEYV